jgi:hypothetical protein
LRHVFAQKAKRRQWGSSGGECHDFYVFVAAQGMWQILMIC